MLYHINLRALLMFVSFTLLAIVYGTQRTPMAVKPTHKQSQMEGGVIERHMTSQEETAQCGVSKSQGLSGQSYATRTDK